LVFASIVDPNRSSSERNALLLVESIRAFAGSLSGAPVWCFTPEHGGQVSATLRARLEALDVTLIPFEMDPDVAAFRFTGEASAAALAESTAEGRVECLAWMNANSLVLREPRGFLLPEGKSLGYRPVHHANIGSRYGEILDPFWTLIYGYCDVPEGRVFPMRTHVDGQVIRPYFNAGCHATRPGKGLLRAWRDVYLTVYDEADLMEFYGRDRRYEVFVHQAIFSGVILSRLSEKEICELPPTYNSPSTYTGRMSRTVALLAWRRTSPSATRGSTRTRTGGIRCRRGNPLNGGSPRGCSLLNLEIPALNIRKNLGAQRGFVVMV